VGEGTGRFYDPESCGRVRRRAAQNPILKGRDGKTSDGWRKIGGNKGIRGGQSL